MPNVKFSARSYAWRLFSGDGALENEEFTLPSVK